jgi:hypothetical protein
MILQAAGLQLTSQSGPGPSVNVVAGPDRTGTAVFHPVAGVPLFASMSSRLPPGRVTHRLPFCTTMITGPGRGGLTRLLVTKLVTRAVKTALQIISEEPFCLVAGAGFEPATSGL